MSPLGSYRRLFSLSGPWYLPVAFLGRLPLSMSQLGTLLLVSTATGSYGSGGLAAGTLAVSNAVGAPVAGGWADRLGQRPVVLVQSSLGALGLVLLVTLSTREAGDAAVVAAAGLAGLLLPQVGPLARVRWRPVTDGAGADQRRLMDAAFSYEGAADEASFVLGPALVGVVALVVDPAGAMLTAAAMLAVFGTAFALHPTAALTGAGFHVHARGRLVTGLLAGLLLAQLFVGMLFGATQTGTTALAEAAGAPGLAGLVHALLGVGSVIAGLATVYLPAHVGQHRRVLVSAAFLVLLSAPLLLVQSLAALVVVVLLLGFGVAPYMIGVFTLGERAVPPGRVGTAMTLLAGATGVGYAAGSGVAGRLTDLHGHTAAFAVTCAAMLGALTLAVLSQRRWATVHSSADVPLASPVAR